MPKPYTLVLPPKVKVLVIVEGGVVQEVRADNHIAVEILDWDNIESGDKWHRMSNRTNIALRVCKMFPRLIL